MTIYLDSVLQDHVSEDISRVDEAVVTNAADDTKAFPLALARNGERLRIASFRTGKGLGKRLGGLGLHKGSIVDIVLHQMNGSVVINHENTKIALGAAAAQMIIVTLCGQIPCE